MTAKRIGYDGLDWHVAGQSVRVHPVVIANHSKLKHALELIKTAAINYLKANLKQELGGTYVVEPGHFFLEADDTINNAITTVLQISGCELEWQEVCAPDDLVRLLLGTEEEPSIIDQLNYPRRAEMITQARESGVPFELQALITCMFLVENGDYATAKDMIESLTPEQLEVITATKTMLLQKSKGDKKLSVQQLADLAGVSIDTAQKVCDLTEPN